MVTEEERKEEIKRAFFEYAAHNTLSAFATLGYCAKQILPDESFFLKVKVIDDLIKSEIMVMRGDRWIIKTVECSSKSS
jgi:hypothetical protein